MAAGGGGIPQFASLYVGDLHSDVTEAMLYEIFNSVGPVASIRICRDSVTRRSLCYGYVNFHSVSDAERALDTLNYSSIKGRSCRIMWSQRDPSMRRGAAGNIYVKNLDKNIDNKALYDTFSLFGNILSCKVASDSTGKSYGYGFVHYETEEAAKQAIERVNGMQIGEKTVQVHVFVKRGERENPALKTYTNLYLKNFPDSWDDAKITEEFSKFGTVTAVCIREHKKDMKMAFVNMLDHEAAEKAVTELHMKELRTPEEIEKAKEEGKEEEQGPDGHPVGKLYVQRAQKKIERSQELKGKFPAPPPKESSPQGVNLYVKNLDESTDEAALKALFEPFGTITSAFSPLDDKGKSKGFGFVCFQSPDEATKAVTEMHLKVVKGKPLYVGLAEKKEARQERLRQRYAPGAGGGAPISTKGAKGAGKGAGGASMPGGMGAGMTGGMMGGAMMGAGMPGMSGMSGMSGMTGMAGMGGGMMNGMAGKGGPQMMGMMPQAMMGMMRPGMMPQAMMGAKGGPMMGNPQMMGMMRPGMMPPGMMQNMMRLQMQGAMMRPQMPGVGMMPGAMGAMGARPMQPQALPAAMGATPGAPLSASALAAAPPSVQKQMIGEKLFLAIAKYQPELAGKITGMMLEMDNSELLILLESEQQLKSKVDEALRVLPADGSK